MKSVVTWCRAMALGAFLGLAVAAPAAPDRLLRDGITLDRHPSGTGRVVTFSSDIDLQSPRFTDVFHHAVSDTIGLPVSDSFWVHATDYMNAVSLFGATALRPDPADPEAYLFWRILELWQQGVLDNIHSWSNDGVPALRYHPDPAVPLAAGGAEIPMPEGPLTEFGPNEYRYVVLRIEGSVSRRFALDVRAGDAWRTLPAAAVSLYTPPGGAVRFVYADLTGQAAEGVLDGYSVPEIAGFRLYDESCEISALGIGCTGQVTALDAVGFSRAMVDSQRPFLDYFTLTPGVFTSHGGFSGHNSMSPPGPQDGPPIRASWLTSPYAVETVENHANLPASHAFHADLLAAAGVRYAWPYYDGSLIALQDDLPSLEVRNPLIYFKRNVVYWAAADEWGSEEAADRYLLDTFGATPEFAASCGPRCDTSQGGFVGVLAWAAQVRSDRVHDPILYTHFGSGNGDILQPPAADRDVLEGMALAADAAYGFDGFDSTDSVRIHVLPQMSFLNGQALSEAAEGRWSPDGAVLQLDTAGLAEPLRATFPDRHDLLNGISLQFDAPELPILEADGQRLKWIFARPLAEGRIEASVHGRQGALEVLGRVPLAFSAAVTDGQGGATLRYQPPGAPPATAFHRFELEGDGAARLCTEVTGVTSHNMTHALLAHRTDGSDALIWQIELDYAGSDGLVLSNAGEAGEALSVLSSAGSLAVLDAGWEHRALPFTEARWGVLQDFVSPGAVAMAEGTADFSHRRPSLPIGQMTRLCVALEGRTGDRLELRELTLARNTAHSPPPEGRETVIGRITVPPDTAPPAIRASSASEVLIAQPNAQGRFALPHVGSELYRLEAWLDDRWCVFHEAQHDPTTPFPYALQTGSDVLALDLARCR